ncbi:MAG: phosphoglycerate kinase [Candidatus Aenigmatarchaeota archaeon]|nr:MAG: phosphoglycerate kinase [Candidatus Aenigmarchaeota archaeon]
MKFNTMDDFEFKGKYVILRVDINSPVIDGKVQDSMRIRRHSLTIKELIEKGARVTVIAHQGRKGDKDFTDLDQHAHLLSKHVGRDIIYVDDIYGDVAKEEIKSLKDGDCILLKNLRYLDEEVQEKSPEEHSKSEMIQELYPLFDFFINDAFSAAHRSHMSMVGFVPVLKSIAGRVMESEIKSIERVTENVKHPALLIVGGSKPDEVIDVMKALLPRKEVDNVLTGGVVGELFLIAAGYDLGKKMEWLEEKGHMKRMDEIKELFHLFRNKIQIPQDLAFDMNGKRVEKRVEFLPVDCNSFDIGSETVKAYKEMIKKARTITMKGPMGEFEDERFGKGTLEILRAIKRSHAFSLLGGGHTSMLLKHFKLDEKGIGYVSIAGGALIKMLSGEKLPAVEALRID